MIEVVDTAAGFASLADDWSSLYRRAQVTNLFVTYPWLALWARHFAPGAMVAAVRREQGQLTGALALVRRADALELPADHSYLPAVLHAAGTASPLGEFLTALRRHTRWIELTHWSYSPHDRREMHRACLAAGVVSLVKHACVQRQIDTTQSFEAYLKARDKKVRQELGRKHRKLERDFADSELLSLCRASAAERAFAAIVEVEADSWKAEAGSAIVSSDVERGFYRGVLELEAPDTTAQTFVLRAGGGAIGYVTGVVHRGVYYALKTSYRAHYAVSAPGQVLYYRVLERLCGDASPITRIELLGGDSRWKRELATHEETRRCYQLTPADVKGRLGWLANERLRPRVLELVKGDERLTRGLRRVRQLGRRARGLVSKD